jgi:hypothetical protein
MDKKIIALTGAKTVGKTTIAKALSAYAINSRILSFATPIKEMLLAMGVPKEAILGEKKETVIKEIGQSGRELMQSLGTEWGRQMIHQNIWVYALQKKIDSGFDQTIIIDDCRFENEAKWVSERGGKIIMIKRDGVSYDDEHSSETPLPFQYIDRVIDTTDLEGGINKVINEFEQMELY